MRHTYTTNFNDIFSYDKKEGIIAVEISSLPNSSVIDIDHDEIELISKQTKRRVIFKLYKVDVIEPNGEIEITGWRFAPINFREMNKKFELLIIND